MSYLKLIRTSLEKTDKRIQHFPKRYYFVPTIIISVLIASYLFYSNSLWYTWTIESTIANITIISLMFWAVGILLSLVSITIFLFISILVQEQRKESKAKKRDEVMEMIHATLVEKGKDLNNELLEDVLQKLNSLLDSIPDESDQLQNKKQYDSFNDAWKNRIRRAENKSELESEIKELRDRVQKLEKKEKSEKTQIIGDKFKSKNSSENTDVGKDNKFEEDL